MAYSEGLKNTSKNIDELAEEQKQFNEEWKTKYILKSFRKHLEDDYVETRDNSRYSFNQYIGGLLCRLDDLEGKEDCFETVTRLNEVIENLK